MKGDAYMSKRGNQKQNRKPPTKVLSITAVDSSCDTPENEETASNKIAVTVEYDQTLGECTIFDEDGKVIAKEKAGKIAINFPRDIATFTTASERDKPAMLKSYDIGTGKKKFFAEFTKKGEIKRI